MKNKQNASVEQKPLFAVRDSKIHGRGVFASRKIAPETRLIEYAGERITARQAAERSGADPDNPYHTFFFSLESGKLIDGGSEGNDARWINHGCEPNCEAVIHEHDGDDRSRDRVFIEALRDIAPGEELTYNYGIVLGERHTPRLKKVWACLCGSPRCTGTMLQPKR